MSAQDDPADLSQIDSMSSSADSIPEIAIDTAAVYNAAHTVFYNSPIISGEKPKWYDI